MLPYFNMKLNKKYLHSLFSSRHLALLSELLSIGTGIAIICLERFIFSKRIIYADTVDYYAYLFLICLVSFIGIIGLAIILKRSTSNMTKLVNCLILFGLIQFIVGLTHILLLYINYHPILLRLCFIRQPNNEFWRALGYEDVVGIQEVLSTCQDEWEWLSYAHLLVWLIYSFVLIINILSVRRYCYRLKRKAQSTLDKLVHSSTWDDKIFTDFDNKEPYQQQKQQLYDEDYYFHYQHHRENDPHQQCYNDSDTDSTKSPASSPSSPTALSPVTISSPICQPTREELEATEALANALYKQRQRLYEEITKNKKLKSGGSKSKRNSKNFKSALASTSSINLPLDDQQPLLKENKPNQYDNNYNNEADDGEIKPILKSFLHEDAGQSRRSSKRHEKLSIKTQSILPPITGYPKHEEEEEKKNALSFSNHKQDIETTTASSFLQSPTDATAYSNKTATIFPQKSVYSDDIATAFPQKPAYSSDNDDNIVSHETEFPKVSAYTEETPTSPQKSAHSDDVEFPNN
ncbi:hypothetical protein BJ944DRAFT_284666 [Cunninghamella echinulata]|nr:hypothetical protein BJ944DRAFT_284666 [Cunninghamella echinulata]